MPKSSGSCALTCEISEQIRSALRRKFAQVDAYRYNSVSVRVRVVDSRFDAKNRVQREKMLLPVLKALPQAVQDEIVFLALLTPDELDHSALNAEFEDGIKVPT